VYKALEPGKGVEGFRWVGRAEAEEEIEDCRRRLAAATEPPPG
jgi:inorganic pyrophosphatase